MATKKTTKRKGKASRKKTIAKKRIVAKKKSTTPRRKKWTPNPRPFAVQPGAVRPFVFLSGTGQYFIGAFVDSLANSSLIAPKPLPVPGGVIEFTYAPGGGAGNYSCPTPIVETGINQYTAIVVNGKQGKIGYNNPVQIIE